MAVHPQRHELRGLSLCSGVGGLDLGLHVAEPRYRTVCFVERDAFAASVLVARMVDEALAPAPIWDDVRSFDGRPWRGRVHILSAGYPCQPFSYSGLRRASDDPRHLWPEVARVVSEVRPEWCFFENVLGHLSLGLDDVIGDLQGMGYRVAARVESAAESGAPHLRQRVFILAHAHDDELRQSGSDHGRARRAEVSAGQEPDRHSGRPSERRVGLDTADVDLDGDRLERGQLPLFAPRPHRFAEWRDHIDRRPELKPALHRLDDGLAFGLERSAAAGNGVCPMAAARAWVHLKAVLHGQ